MKIIISTIRSNRILKTSLAVSFLLFVLMVGFLVFGHFVIEKLLQEKSTTVDLSDSSTQKRYNRLIADFNNLKNERESLKSIRIAKDDVVTLVQYFEEISLRSKVQQTVGIVTADDLKNKKEYNVPTVRYKINIAGENLAIREYLESLRSAPFFLRIESFEITAPDENSLTGDYLATIFVAVAIKE